MSRKQPSLTISLLLFPCLVIGFLLLGQQRSNAADAKTPVVSPAGGDPYALIKTIVARGAEVERVPPSDVAIARSASTTGAEMGMILYAGDQITTGKDVRLTLLFLDNAAEKDNEILVDEMTKVQLGSLFTSSGRILAKVKDKFQTKTARAEWSVAGTEYELEVQADGTNLLRVLKGAVQATPGTFTPATSSLPNRPNPPDAAMAHISSQAGASPSPTLPVATPIVITRIQELILPPAGDSRRAEASVQALEQTLNWSDRLIVPGSPSYSAQSVVPRFQTWTERERMFRVSRRSSVINDDRRSKEILADVYIDWGNGAKAEEELKNVEVPSREIYARLTTLGEARRLMGDLPKAEELSKRATNLEPNWATAYNALGNVYLDMAKVEQDKTTYSAARASLEKANSAYRKALEVSRAGNAPPASQSVAGANRIQTVAQSNLGEVHLRLGEIARATGESNNALSAFQMAEQAFAEAAKMDQSYQFAFCGLGDVYREIGMTQGALGNQAKAAEYFTRSQEQYSAALRLHKDMAEAYVGSGRTFEAAGRKAEAQQQYLKATLVRPELADPHYYLALALAGEAPARASEQALVYLKMERPSFKQGEKSRNAQTVAEGRTVPTPTVTPKVSPTPKKDSPTETSKPVSISRMPVDRPRSLWFFSQILGFRTLRA